MEKKQLWTIVGVALVVAVIASIATASITGNVIRVSKGLYGPVYTTAEVDAKLANIKSGTPKNCMVHSFSSSVYNNGDTLCAKQTANKCLIGELTLVATTNKTTSSGYLELVAVYPKFFKCSDTFAGVYNETTPGLFINKEYQVICCD